MRERFKFKRMLDAFCYLLKLNGGKEGDIDMFDLLYLADREYLRKYGQTITGDYPVGLVEGPTISFSRKKNKDLPDKWNEHICLNDNFLFEIEKETDYGDLCPASCEVLENIHKTYSDYDPDELAAMMRKYPEYNWVVGDDPEAYFKENGWSAVNLRWTDALRDIPQMVFAYIENIEIDEATTSLFGEDKL